MDMITKIEIQDAIANFKKVQDRVSEVAFMVANSMREFAGVESDLWRVDNFSFSSGNPGAGIEPQCHVLFSVHWSDRPVTAKYGDPEIDDDGFTASSEYLHRHITFPTRYLTTDDWVPEMERKAAEKNEWVRQRQMEALREVIEGRKKDLSDLRAKLEELKSTK